MTRKVIQTATNPASRSGTAHPASMPSSQLRKGFRQRAGEISERAAISENEKSMGTKTHGQEGNSPDSISRCSEGDNHGEIQATSNEAARTTPLTLRAWINGPSAPERRADLDQSGCPVSSLRRIDRRFRQGRDPRRPQIPCYTASRTTRPDRKD